MLYVLPVNALGRGFFVHAIGWELPLEQEQFPARLEALLIRSGFGFEYNDIA